jgi:hypothetical protein
MKIEISNPAPRPIVTHNGGSYRTQTAADFAAECRRDIFAGRAADDRAAWLALLASPRASVFGVAA